MQSHCYPFLKKFSGPNYGYHILWTACLLSNLSQGKVYFSCHRLLEEHKKERKKKLSKQFYLQIRFSSFFLFAILEILNTAADRVIKQKFMQPCKK